MTEKGLEIAGNGQKWVNMDDNRFEWFGMAWNGLKWLGKGLTWLEGLEIAGHYWKQLEIGRNS